MLRKPLIVFVWASPRCVFLSTVLDRLMAREFLANRLTELQLVSHEISLVGDVPFRVEAIWMDRRQLLQQWGQ